MAATSAGILLYRRAPELQVLLVHPGGPYWAKKDQGAWTLPKGGYRDPEEPLQAALREFGEETGLTLDPEPDQPINLGVVKYSGGKEVRAWALEGEFNLGKLESNSMEMEWPPRSGRTQAFPEVDRAGWFSLEEARAKILPAQAPFLERLEEELSS